MNKTMLIRLGETYGQHCGLKLSTVSTYAAGDGKFLGSLKGAAGCTIRRADRVLAWFDDHWPCDLEWPADIPRPSGKSEDAA
jgi:hypothetical protein